MEDKDMLDGNSTEGASRADFGGVEAGERREEGLKMEGAEKAQKGAKTKKMGILIGFLVFLAMIGVGFGVTGMILWQQEKGRVPEGVETEVVTVTEVVEKGTTAEMLMLDNDKALDDKRPFYSIDYRSEVGWLYWLEGKLFFQAYIEEDFMDYNALELPKDKLVDMGERKIWQDEIVVQGVKQDEVAEYMFGMFGHASGGLKLLLLMRDGTVEYMPVLEALESGEMRMYGKADGVSEVIRLINVHVSGGIGGGLTVLAQKANGEFYDLHYHLPD